jgi:hypothetical protein
MSERKQVVDTKEYWGCTIYIVDFFDESGRRLRREYQLGGWRPYSTLAEAKRQIESEVKAAYAFQREWILKK